MAIHVLLPLLLLLLLQLSLPSPGNAELLDLGGKRVWTFKSPDNSSYAGKAYRVPGDIYGDLQSLGYIGSILHGENDRAYRWVARLDWTYQRLFQAPEAAMQAEFVLLHLEGLDTIADVYFNGKHILRSINQFIEHTLSVGHLLVAGGNNNLTIAFESPIEYGEQQQEDYKELHGYAVPPECPPDLFNGECNGNEIRKIQSSFAWDWGVAAPTTGVWKPIYMEWFDQIAIESFSPAVVAEEGDFFLVGALISVVCSPSLPSMMEATLIVPELQLQSSTPLNVGEMCSATNVSLVEVELLNIRVNKSAVGRWYPKGYGKQRLYEVAVQVGTPNTKYAKDSKRIGFKTVELHQDLIDANNKSKGREYYFTINGVPVFLKGTNWIPVSAFPGRQHHRRRLFLQHSMELIHLNSLRVWGGGMYEDEEFMEWADENGVMVWQDLMFACSAYPAGEEFLTNVAAEVRQHALRLRTHPSIFVWAGNNENELAITGGWFSLPRNKLEPDYKLLYEHTLRPIIAQLDPTNIWMTSSPSNGIESQEEGGLAKWPSDPHFGDIHFYTETVNLWKDFNYQVPRCVSEYGVQSLPLKGTFMKWIEEGQFSYGSKSITARQHHPGGVLNQLLMASQHFDLGKVSGGCEGKGEALLHCPSIMNSSAFLDQFTLLSQLHQAVAMKVQTEHYRRSRNHYDSDGYGNTMGALYWQLNDVWAAPSWSSIDYNLNWKVLHYYLRKFFAPVIVSMSLDKEDSLHLYVVSDLLQPLPNVTLRLQMFLIGEGFMPLYESNTTLTVKAAQSSNIPLSTLDGPGPRIEKVLELSDLNSYILRADLVGLGVGEGGGQRDAYSTTLLPDKLYSTETFGNVSLVAVKRLNADMFEVELHATDIVPFVWLDLKEQVKEQHKALFYFSDNGFAMLEPNVSVNLTIFTSRKSSPLSSLGLHDIVVRQL